MIISLFISALRCVSVCACASVCAYACARKRVRVRVIPGSGIGSDTWYW